MNLLFDQNISHRVVLALKERIPTARHVRDFGLQFGNNHTQHLASRIVERADLIMSFISDPSFAEVSCLEIDR